MGVLSFLFKGAAVAVVLVAVAAGYVLNSKVRPTATVLATFHRSPTSSPTHPLIHSPTHSLTYAPTKIYAPI